MVLDRLPGSRSRWATDWLLLLSHSCCSSLLCLVTSLNQPLVKNILICWWKTSTCTTCTGEINPSCATELRIRNVSWTPISMTQRGAHHQLTTSQPSINQLTSWRIKHHELLFNGHYRPSWLSTMKYNRKKLPYWDVSVSHVGTPNATTRQLSGESINVRHWYPNSLDFSRDKWSFSG